MKENISKNQKKKKKKNKKKNEKGKAPPDSFDFSEILGLVNDNNGHFLVNLRIPTLL